MSDRLDIYNRALLSLGAEPLTEETGTTTVHKIIEGFYEESVIAMFEARPWSWSSGIDESTGVQDGNEWRHSLPAGPAGITPMRAHRVLPVGTFWTGPINAQNSTVPTRQLNWRQEGADIVTDEQTVLIQWAGAVTDETAWPWSFANAVAARLAFDICIPITKNVELLQVMAAKYTSAMTEAERDDDSRGRADKRQATSLVGVR